LGDADAGHVAGHVADAAHRLIVDQLAGDDGDGLRDVNEGGVGLGGRDAALDGVAVLAVVAVDLEFFELQDLIGRRQITGSHFRLGDSGCGKGAAGESQRDGAAR